MHDDFEMFIRVRRSIEYLCLTFGLRKNYAREVGIRTVPQYQICLNVLFWGLFRGSRAKIPIESVMFAIASSGVDIHRTINLAS